MYILIPSFYSFFFSDVILWIITLIFIWSVSDILFESIGILRPFDIYASLQTQKPEEFQSL